MDDQLKSFLKDRERRNAKIRAAYATGKYTLEQIGKRFSISRQRVFQVIFPKGRHPQ